MRIQALTSSTHFNHCKPILCSPNILLGEFNIEEKKCPIRKSNRTLEVSELCMALWPRSKNERKNTDFYC